MNYAQAILLALFSAVAVGCVEGLQEVYELEDTRILGMQANPPEIALTSEGTQVVTVKPFVYLPEGVTITSTRWTFCPFAAGGELGYRCFLEECLVDITDSVNSDGILEFEPLTKGIECLESLEDSGAPVGTQGDAGDASEFEQLPTQVRYIIETSDGQSREAVKRIPIWFEEPEVGLNRNPEINAVSVGGQAVSAEGDAVNVVLTKEGEGTFERSKVDMGFEAVAESFDQYLAGDTLRREDAQWTLFVTEGNLGVVGNRLVGDQASGEWAKEDSEDLPELIELWVALRDGRTGQSIEGPFYFRATEEP